MSLLSELSDDEDTEDEEIAYHLAAIALRLQKRGMTDVYLQLVKVRNDLLAILDDKAQKKVCG